MQRWSVLILVITIASADGQLFGERSKQQSPGLHQQQQAIYSKISKLQHALKQTNEDPRRRIMYFPGNADSIIMANISRLFNWELAPGCMPLVCPNMQYSLFCEVELYPALYNLNAACFGNLTQQHWVHATSVDGIGVRGYMAYWPGMEVYAYRGLCPPSKQFVTPLHSFFFMLGWTCENFLTFYWNWFITPSALQKERIDLTIYDNLLEESFNPEPKVILAMSRGAVIAKWYLDVMEGVQNVGWAGFAEQDLPLPNFTIPITHFITLGGPFGGFPAVPVGIHFLSKGWPLPIAAYDYGSFFDLVNSAALELWADPFVWNPSTEVIFSFQGQGFRPYWRSIPNIIEALQLPTWILWYFEQTPWNFPGWWSTYPSGAGNATVVCGTSYLTSTMNADVSGLDYPNQTEWLFSYEGDGLTPYKSCAIADIWSAANPDRDIELVTLRGVHHSELWFYSVLQWLPHCFEAWPFWESSGFIDLSISLYWKNI